MMTPAQRSTIDLLIAAVDVFLANPDTNYIVITRTENGQGNNSANIFEGNPQDGKAHTIIFTEFQHGSTTIYDQDPDWKQNFLKDAKD